MNSKNFVMSLVSISISLAVGLGVAEFAVRKVIPAYDPSGQLAFHYDREWGITRGPRDSVVRQTKNTGDFDVKIHFNPLGFRDSDDIKALGRDDWFAVGDSQSFGWGVEEDEVVTSRLEALTGRRFYNISAPASPLEWPRVVDYANANGAKVSRLMIFYNTEIRLQVHTPPSQQEEQPQAPRRWQLQNVKQWLTRNSALYTLATSFIHASPAAKAMAIKWGLIAPVHEGFVPRAYDAAAIESSVAAVTAMNEKFPGSVVVALPNRGLYLSDKAEVTRMYEDFVARLRQSGVEVIDVRPVFDREPEPLKLFFKTDAHWTPRGHDLVAQEVAAYLNRRVAGNGVTQ